jgi:hypothetical protein
MTGARVLTDREPILASFLAFRNGKLFKMWRLIEDTHL